MFFTKTYLYPSFVIWDSCLYHVLSHYSDWKECLYTTFDKTEKKDWKFRRVVEKNWSRNWKSESRHRRNIEKSQSESKTLDAIDDGHYHAVVTDTFDETIYSTRRPWREGDFRQTTKSRDIGQRKWQLRKNRYHGTATNSHAVVSVVVEKASTRRRSRIPCVVVKKLGYALAWSWKKLRRVDVKA